MKLISHLKNGKFLNSLQNSQQNLNWLDHFTHLLIVI